MKEIKHETSSINIEEYFNNGANINELLTKLEIDNYELKDIKSHYQIDGYRHGVIAIFREKDTGNLLRFIIEATIDCPTWEHMEDLTFGIGNGCDKIIVILYDGPVGYQNTAYNHDFDEYMSESFMKFNNTQFTDTYVVEMSVQKDESNDVVFDYEIRERPNDTESGKEDMKTAFSKRDLEKMVFRTYTNEIFGFEPTLKFEPQNWYRDEDLKGYVCRGIYSKWSQDGFFVYVVADTKERVDDIKSMVEECYDEIHELLKDYSVKILEKSETSFLISIKVSDEPFTNFANATSNEKYDLLKDIMEKRELPVYTLYENYFG